jgi:hypothetical protein
MQLFDRGDSVCLPADVELGHRADLGDSGVPVVIRQAVDEADGAGGLAEQRRGGVEGCQYAAFQRFRHDLPAGVSLYGSGRPLARE